VISVRICMLTTGFPRWPGDLFGSFVFELARRPTTLGIEVHVVAPHQHGLRPREERDGIFIHRFRYAFPSVCQRVAYGGGIPTNLKGNAWLWAQVPFFLLGFWWRAFRVACRCDVVHAHWTISGLVGYLAARIWRRPVVLSVRGSDIHLVRQGSVRRLHGWIYTRMDTVVAVSADIADRLIASGVPAVKVHTVFNGVDGRFRPRSREQARQELQLAMDRFIVLFVGLLVPVKGVDTLIAAVAEAHLPELLCVVVGDGAARGPLEEQADGLGVTAHFSFVGRQSSQVVPRWMNAADVLVLPSRSEGRPNVVLEAQASALPVVATRVGGTPELIEDGISGPLVEEDDPAGLARALHRLAGDRDLRERLGNRGREHLVRQGLTWEASARAMVGIYHELVRGSVR